MDYAFYSRNIRDLQMVVQVPYELIINIKPIHLQNELTSCNNKLEAGNHFRRMKGLATNITKATESTI